MRVGRPESIKAQWRCMEMILQKDVRNPMHTIQRLWRSVCPYGVKAQSMPARGGADDPVRSVCFNGSLSIRVIEVTGAQAEVRCIRSTEETVETQRTEGILESRIPQVVVTDDEKPNVMET